MEGPDCPRVSDGKPPVCGKCSVEGHRIIGCTANFFKCPNCGGAHTASDDRCHDDETDKHRRECARFQVRGPTWQPALEQKLNEEQRSSSSECLVNPNQVDESIGSQPRQPQTNEPPQTGSRSYIASSVVEASSDCMITEQRSQTGRHVGSAVFVPDNDPTVLKEKLSQRAINDYYDPVLDGGLNDEDFGECLRNFDPHVDDPSCSPTPSINLPRSPDKSTQNQLNLRSSTSNPAPVQDDVFGDNGEDSGLLVSNARSDSSRNPISKPTKPVASKPISFAAMPTHPLGQVPLSGRSIGPSSEPLTVSSDKFMPVAQSRQHRPSSVSPNSFMPPLPASLQDDISSASQTRRTQNLAQSPTASARPSMSQRQKSPYTPTRKPGRSTLPSSRPAKPSNSLEEASKARSWTSAIDQVPISAGPVTALGPTVDFVGSMQQPQDAIFQVDQAMSSIVAPDGPSTPPNSAQQLHDATLQQGQAVSPIVISDEPSIYPDSTQQPEASNPNSHKSLQPAKPNAFDRLQQPERKDSKQKGKGDRRKRKGRLTSDGQGDSPEKTKQYESIGLDDIERILYVVKNRGRYGPPKVWLKLKNSSEAEGVSKDQFKDLVGVLRRAQHESAEELRPVNAWSNAKIEAYIHKLENPAGSSKSPKQKGSVPKRTLKQVAEETSILSVRHELEQMHEAKAKANRVDQIREAQKKWASDRKNPNFTDNDSDSGIPTEGDKLTEGDTPTEEDVMAAERETSDSCKTGHWS